MTVDSYRFLDFMTRVVVKAWIARERPAPIPWSPPRRPLSQCRVALVTSAGLVRTGDRPFDRERERRDPWWGDPTFRTIPHGTSGDDLEVCHLHVDPRFAREDADVLLPMRRLDDLVAAGVVGGASPVHWSFMGYQLRADELVERHAPAVAAQMRDRAVDAAVLVPA